MEAYKILITGTHSVGKSTLLELMKSDERFHHFEFIGGVTREAKSFGLEINENGTEMTQMYCIASDFLNLVKKKNQPVVYDRSIIDTMIYSMYLLPEHSLVRKLSEYLCQQLIDKFDLIVWLRPVIQVEVTDDGIRSTDQHFRERIDKCFEEFFEETKLKNIVWCRTLDSHSILNLIKQKI